MRGREDLKLSSLIVILYELYLTSSRNLSAGCFIVYCCQRLVQDIIHLIATIGSTDRVRRAVRRYIRRSDHVCRISA